MYHMLLSCTLPALKWPRGGKRTDRSRGKGSRKRGGGVSVTNYARVGKNLKGKKSRFPFRFREKNNASVVASSSDGVVGRRKRDPTTVVVVDAAFDFLNDGVLPASGIWWHGACTAWLSSYWLWRQDTGFLFFPLCYGMSRKKRFSPSVSQSVSSHVRRQERLLLL